jgi:DNA-binding phage protein
MEGGAVMDDQHPVTDAEHITHTHELLAYTARWAQDRPAYVAWALARVQAREGLSDEALAARLGIASVDLPRLALCLRPRPEHWAEDLAQIATRFGLASEPLAAVLGAEEAPTARRHDPTDSQR